MRVNGVTLSFPINGHRALQRMMKRESICVRFCGDGVVTRILKLALARLGEVTDFVVRTRGMIKLTENFCSRRSSCRRHADHFTSIRMQIDE